MIVDKGCDKSIHLVISWGLAGLLVFVPVLLAQFGLCILYTMWITYVSMPIMVLYHTP